VAAIRPPIRLAYVVLWLWGPLVSAIGGASWIFAALRAMTRKEMCPDLVGDRDLPLMSRKEKERDRETLADSRREKSIGYWESELGITIWGGRRRRGPWETLDAPP
jgi:hypothetical protein